MKTETLNQRLAVETSPSDPPYHGILDQSGTEVGRVHMGDDQERRKELAELMARAPELLQALIKLHDAYRDIPFSPSRADRTDAMMTAELLIRELR